MAGALIIDAIDRPPTPLARAGSCPGTPLRATLGRSQALDARIIGEVRTVIVDFGEWFADDHRIMRLELAGGPLLDLGTYPLKS